MPRALELRAALERWAAAAGSLDRAMTALPSTDPDRLAELDRRLRLLPGGFYGAEGHPENALQRNLWNGFSRDSTLETSGGSLPGLRFALDRGDAAAAARESSLYLDAIERRAAELAAITAELGRHR